MRPVVIMHISDLHFGIPEKSRKGYPILNRDAVLNSFHSSFNKIPEKWKPDILVVSGDIGWAGKKEDYQEATSFFENFLNIDNQKVKRQNIILCPGNHDVYHDDNQLGLWERRRLQCDKSLEDSTNNGVLALDRGIVRLLNSQFLNYEEFCLKMGFAKLMNSSNCYSHVYGSCVLENIRFVVMNTEWDFMGKNDRTECKGRLRMGTDLLDDAQEQLMNYEDANDSPLISVHHRPFDEWFHISERYVGSYNGHKSVKEKLSLHDISLTGHIHESKITIGKYTRKIFTAGAIHSNENGVEFSCNLIRIYPDYSLKSETQPYSCDYAYFQYKNPLPNSGNINRSWKFVEPSQPTLPIFRIASQDAEQVQEFSLLIEKYMEVINKGYTQLDDMTSNIGLNIRKLWSGFDDGLRRYFLSIDGMSDLFNKISNELHKQHKKTVESSGSNDHFKGRELVRALHDDPLSNAGVNEFNEGNARGSSPLINVDTQQVNTENVVRKEIIGT